MQKIIFIGAPGSGKSTLAAQTFTALKTNGHVVELVDEFIRRDIQAHGPMTSIWEQYRTRYRQMETEDVVPQNVEYLISDSGTLSPFFYASLYVDATDSRQRLVLQDMYRYLLDDLFLERYSKIFYLPVVPGTDHEDGTRFQNTQEIMTLAEHMELIFVKIFNKNVHMISGPFESRLGKVLKIIDTP